MGSIIPQGCECVCVCICCSSTVRAHAIFIFCESAEAVEKKRGGGGELCFSAPLHVNATATCGGEGEGKEKGRGLGGVAEQKRDLNGSDCKAAGRWLTPMSPSLRQSQSEAEKNIRSSLWRILRVLFSLILKK